MNIACELMPFPRAILRLTEAALVGGLLSLQRGCRCGEVKSKRLTPRPRLMQHQPEGRGSFNEIERASLAADTAGLATMIKRLPTGFVIPAQPVKASTPPVGTDWVHEIKHDGYRIIVRRDGPIMRLYSRNAYDRTGRLSAIAAAAERIKAKSFTIDGEAVVLGPHGLSRFEELSCREGARTAILYAFDLIEHSHAVDVGSGSTASAKPEDVAFADRFGGERLATGSRR